MSPSPENRKWRRMPISALAYTIRIEGVRHANIYPTCRLDKSNRALYEPEDVWAKRAALAKIGSRSSANAKMKGLLKQRVITISTTRVTKENMEAVDRVKQAVAVLMKNKERAADIGSAERRILQPRVARDMDRMNPERRAEFEGRVQMTIERMVYAAKRRYIRRQEKLDEAGIFHPEANAQRVHTQFWADLQSKVDLTKIENAVWAKMSTEMEETRTHAKTPNKPLIRRTAAVAHEVNESKPGPITCNSSSRPRLPSTHREEQEQRSRDEVGNDSGTLDTVADDDSLLASSLDKFDGIPGYDEVGHVPTLEEFRQEWPRVDSRPINSQQIEAAGGGSSNGARRGLAQGQGQGQSTTGSLVQSLSKKDEVFRHFVKYYDKVEQNRGVAGVSSGGMRGLSFLTAGSATGILPPDFSIVEAIGQHSAEVEETRNRSKIGEGIMSTTTVSSRRQIHQGSGEKTQSRSAGPQKSSGGDGESAGHVDGLANVFEMSVEASEDSRRRAVQSALTAFSGKGATDETATTSNVSETWTRGDENGGNVNGGERIHQSRSSPSLKNKEISGSASPAKGSLEGSSTTAALKTTLEAAWRALQVPARLKLDFLQKYSTLERALDLPRVVQLMDIAGKLIPLREKVIDLLQRINKHGEPILAMSAFSAAEEDCLYDLDCWMEFASTVKDTAHRKDKRPSIGKNKNILTAEYQEAGADRDAEEGKRHVDERNVDEEKAHFSGVSGDGVQRKENRTGVDASTEDKRRREDTTPAPVITWLKMIKFKLTEKCADTCDSAWYEVGETITYQGRSVAAGLPPAVVEGAIFRREDRENISVRKRRIG